MSWDKFIIVSVLFFLSDVSSSFEQSDYWQNRSWVTSLEQVDCWFDPPKTKPVTSCFYMSVPENYADPESRWIRFSVVKLHALGESVKDIPVLHLGGGGPGNPIGFWPDSNVSWIWKLYQSMSVQNQRDLYMIDPRGVGQSDPVLVCPEYVDMIETALTQNLSNDDESRLAMQAYNLCRDRLTSDNINLSQYHSANVARDMNSLRLALGLDKWNLYGVSYATRYAQTIARDFPNIVQSMVLDAATFPGINYTERSGRDLLNTFERLFNYCDSNAACKNDLGDVRSRFWSLVSSLEREPILFEVNHPYQSGKQGVMLTGSRFMNAYYNAIYDANYYSSLPNVINNLENGRLGKFRSAMEEWLEFIADRDYADGAAITHYCYEEAPFVDFESAIDNTEKLPVVVGEMVKDGLEFARQQCIDWGVMKADAREAEVIKTDVPTLFLHGTLDPVLPVEDLYDQTVNFNRSDSVVFEGISHGVLGSDPCAIKLARAFYDYQLEYRQHEPCLE